MKIKELKVGNVGTVECIIVSIEERKNKNNGIFINLCISDGESQVIAKKWNTKLETFAFKEGQAVLVELKAEEYKGDANYIVREITESSTDPQQLICGAPIPSENMFAFLLKTADKCGIYACVVKKILSDYRDKLMSWSAAKSIHHNIHGGLLYHTYRMTKTAVYVANIYNHEPSMLKNCRNINTELLVAGTILHDIGKLWELNTNQFGAAEYTVKGTMMGHIFIGAELVGRYARAAKLPEEDVMLLQHLLLSHHGKYEYRAAVLPAIPEAMILHHIDMIDSCMYQFESQSETLEPGTLSGPVYGLDQKVYRPTWRVQDSQN